eukprot:14952954-Alexandrium_andersonii.AAC.1
MSASLVGSEMCIRDRSRAPHQQARWYSDGTHGGCGRSLLVVWAAVAPVSYTHLTLPTICSV